MKAESLAPPDHAEWDRFVDATQGGHLFLTAGWHRAWGLVPQVRVVRDGARNICGGLAFVPGRFLAAAAVRRPVFTPYNHPLIDEGRLPRVSQQVEAMAALVGDLAAFSTLDFVFRHGAALAAPFFFHAGFENRMTITYVIEASGRDRWREGLSKSHRYDLRRAEEQAARERWQVAPCAEAAEAWELFRTTGARKDFSLDLSGAAFAAAVRGLHERRAGELWALRDASGRMLAASLLVRDRCFAYYLANGAAADLPRPFLGNYLLLRSMIDDTMERGLGFDFEGSVLPGVEQFFRGFGGSLRTNVRQIGMSPARSLVWSIGSWARSRRRGA